MSDLDEAELSELLQAQQAQHTGSLAKGKKRYTPPKADENTFETQEEFINSLVAIPITSVEEYNRRCAHCWKDYGDSDPGADNAENPVKFRCGHVFGEACMKEVFKLPSVVKIELRPLSFGLDSRGYELAGSLKTYLNIKFDELNDPHIDMASISVEDRFVALMNTIEKPDKRISASSILGPYFSLIQQVVYSHHKVLKVHLLENGLVYDISGPEPVSLFGHGIENYPPHYPPHHFSPFSSYSQPPPFAGSSTSLDDEVKTLILNHVKAKAPDHEAELFEILYEHDIQWQPISSSSSITSEPPKSPTALAIDATSEKQPENLPEKTSENPEEEPSQKSSQKPSTSGPFPPLKHLPQEHEIQWQSTSSSSSTTSKPSKDESVPPINIPVPKPSTSGSFSPKAGSLPSKLPSTFSLSNTFHNIHHALQSSQTSTPVNLSPFGSNVLASASTSTSAVSGLNKVPALATPLTNFSSILSADNISTPDEYLHSIFAAVQSNDLQVAKSPNKSIAELYNSAWGHLQTKAPYALPLKTLDELKESAKTTMMAKAEEKKKEIEAAKKRAAQAEAEREVRKKAKFEIIATALAKVVDEYKEHDPERTKLLAPSPPPLKKLKLDPLVVKLKPQCQNVLHAGATLHKKDLGTTHYTISQPYDSLAADHGDDDSEADVGTDGEGEEHEHDMKESLRMVVLVRSLCMGGCFPGDARIAAVKRFGDPPESIGWKDVKSAPDCCPLCKRILFKKAGEKGGR